MTGQNSTRRKRSLVAAGRTGSEVEALGVLRDIIATRLDDSEISTRDLTALSKRYLDVLKALNPDEPASWTVPGQPVPDAPFHYEDI